MIEDESRISHVHPASGPRIAAYRPAPGCALARMAVRTGNAR